MALAFCSLLGCRGDSDVITRAEFEQLKDGMTYEQANAVLGAKGVQNVSRSSDGITHRVYSWQNKDKSTVMCIFQDGKLVIKVQDKLPQK